MTSPSPMKSPDRDAADTMPPGDLTNEQVANMVRMLMRTDLDHEFVCVLARDRILSLASELATLRRRVAELEAHKTPMPVSGDSMYCGKCNQWLADGRRLLWHHASGKYYCIGCDPGSPPARKELADVTIKDCPTCGGIHYGSHECPYISAPCAVCGGDTILACSDCGINSAGKQSIHVCKKTECRDAHEQARHSQALPPGRNEG